MKSSFFLWAGATDSGWFISTLQLGVELEDGIEEGVAMFTCPQRIIDVILETIWFSEICIFKQMPPYGLNYLYLRNCF